ncbi:hypothetical protein TNIN_347491 [Trichonephila inaurata madagascariensis]|uniref:Uncharacterized protein n=1 Tax=Trichonephila inaurata madagascariensis TaxID=2747483 RepID=A0A8X6Y3S9_9ARAC|nr:hypothetical protein TNIN_347491 [Trichonephila inaurata madagascariensis]
MEGLAGPGQSNLVSTSQLRYHGFAKIMLLLEVNQKWKLRQRNLYDVYQLRCRPRHWSIVQNYEVRRQ